MVKVIQHLSMKVFACDKVRERVTVVGTAGITDRKKPSLSKVIR